MSIECSSCGNVLGEEHIINRETMASDAYIKIEDTVYECPQCDTTQIERILVPKMKAERIKLDFILDKEFNEG